MRKVLECNCACQGEPAGMEGEERMGRSELTGTGGSWLYLVFMLGGREEKEGHYCHTSRNFFIQVHLDLPFVGKAGGGKASENIPAGCICQSAGLSTS